MNTSSISLKALSGLLTVAVLSLLVTGCHTWGHNGHGEYGGYQGEQHGSAHPRRHHDD